MHSLGALGERLPALQGFFLESDSLTNSAYRDLFDVPYSVATRELGSLVKSRVLIRRGAKRGTYYVASARL